MFRPFPIAPSSRSKPLPAIDAIDVAARYFVYKLSDATNGQPGAWHKLGGIGERPETVAKAVERGWVVIRKEGGKGKVQSGALTNEGRVVARKGLRGL